MGGIGILKSDAKIKLKKEMELQEEQDAREKMTKMEKLILKCIRFGVWVFFIFCLGLVLFVLVVLVFDRTGNLENLSSIFGSLFKVGDSFATKSGCREIATSEFTDLTFSTENVLCLLIQYDVTLVITIANIIFPMLF